MENQVNDTAEDGLRGAEVILFIKMLRFRYPYLEFRENRLGVVSWYCISEPLDGLPDTWMLIYLYRNQLALRRYLNLPYENESLLEN